MKIATSYFYQIRNFKPWMIPVSTAMSDPEWYRPPEGKEYYFDKREIVCGLRYEPLIVQGMGEHICPCELHDDMLLHPEKSGLCATMIEYRMLLENVDFDRMIKGFNYCANKFCKDFEEEPIIVLMVYEAPSNPCSERWALQDYFKSHGWECKELKYPI